MIRWSRWGLVMVGAGLVVAASAGWSLRAQDRTAKVPAAKAVAARVSTVSIQDALFRPIDLPFGEETSLEVVRGYLSRTLNAPVVLDVAALDRLELTAEDTVRLDLKGVRLKVGLKLLLDQVGLSYRVEAEDNLLILTDAQASDEPARRVFAELKSLHRDIHDLQDAVDDLRDLVEEDLEVEPEPSKERLTLVGRRKSKSRTPRLTGRSR